MTTPKVLICPYCGETQSVRDACQSCGGHFEPLSRQATHNAMGPWFVRDDANPHRPGCSYETLVNLVEKGRVGKHTIVRGPTTKQFWNVARRVPGLAHLFGYCHNCAAPVDQEDHGCHACGTPFGAYLDRNYLGLPDIRPLPWEADMGDDIRAGHHRAAGTGISSFASDAELTGAAVAAAERAALTATPGPPAGPRTVGSDETEVLQGSATRSMQRRIAGQSRMIRTLVIMLLISTGVLVAFSVLTIAPMLRGDPTATLAGEPVAEPVAPAPDPVDAAPVSPAPVTKLPEPPRESVWQSDWDRAITLEADAADMTRSRSERLRSLDDALAILDRIRRDVPPADQPADLEERRKSIEEARERAKLEEFFP